MNEMASGTSADTLAAIARDALAQFVVSAEGDEGSNLLVRVEALRSLGVEAEEESHEARLLRLSRDLSLDAGEVLALAVCFEVERDPVFARQVAMVQEPVGKSRPMIGMLARCVENPGDRVLALSIGTAVRSGLLTLGDEEAPLGERSLYLAPHMVAALSGCALAAPGFGLPKASNVRLAGSQRRAAGELATFLSESSDPASVVIRSSALAEGLALAQAMARTMGKCVALSEAAEAGPCHAAWFAALKVLPCFHAGGGPGETWKVPPRQTYHGPLVVIAGPDTRIEAAGSLREYRLAVPDPAERAELWRDHGLAAESAERAARSYRQGSGRIAEIAARLPGASPGWEDVKSLVQAPAHDLGIAAQHIRTAKVARDGLVLTEDLASALDELTERVWHRDGLADGLGPALTARYSPGVTALMCGESGTGKTLAAHWLAERIGLPLYRVDMAALTSKWIGETEKNLSHLLATAEQADLILFFDEADSLFGARTDVADSHDRYANAQTNFLLQRFEEFDGIALLSTNSRDRFDSAFVRRIDAILEFPMPDAAARRDLWQQHLGEGHDLDAADIDRLAVEVDIAGGHIRNAVLGAAARSRREDRLIARGDIAAAVRREYAKLGKAGLPLEAW
jgi:hypothetical protein